MPNIDILKKLYIDDPKAIFNVIDQIYDRIDREGLNGIWISIVPREKVRHRAEQLMSLSTEDRQKTFTFRYSICSQRQYRCCWIENNSCLSKFCL